MGQSLLVAQLPGGVEAYGVDSDLEAEETGRRLAPPNIKLVYARGEELPFEDGYFDLVFSRVAIPYMEINKALWEFSRVLKKGGDVWLALHPISMYLNRARRSAQDRRLNDVLFCSYVLLNGALFSYFALQFSFLGHQETFQTFGRIAAAMKKAGLTCRPVKSEGYFIVQGQKAPLQRGADK
jgi:ubiquinone/menaquinone biosynthesis C-methylase UbiE